MDVENALVNPERKNRVFHDNSPRFGGGVKSNGIFFFGKGLGRVLRFGGDLWVCCEGRDGGFFLGIFFKFGMRMGFFGRKGSFARYRVECIGGCKVLVCSVDGKGIENIYKYLFSTNSICRVIFDSACHILSPLSCLLGFRSTRSIVARPRPHQCTWCLHTSVHSPYLKCLICRGRLGLYPLNPLPGVTRSYPELPGTGEAKIQQSPTDTTMLHLSIQEQPNGHFRNLAGLVRPFTIHMLRITLNVCSKEQLAGKHHLIFSQRFRRSQFSSFHTCATHRA